jgi:multicomponent Na+:H+ antiporter subunit B
VRKQYGSTILDTAIRMLIPFYLVYGVYVLIHGHYSPGADSSREWFLPPVCF